MNVHTFLSKRFINCNNYVKFRTESGVLKNSQCGGEHGDVVNN